MDRSPVQGILTKRLNGYIVSEVISELEGAKGPNAWNNNI
jgi:hypothetical protein